MELLNGLQIFHLRRFEDSRGQFTEAFLEKQLNIKFVQDNFSVSKRGVIRGMHYQIINPQGKLVFVTHGKILDVAVDLRSNSETFGKWFGVELSAKNGAAIYIPAGFAHGFQALTKDASVFYKCTDYYNPLGERTLIFDDSEVGIQWNNIESVVSQKDLCGLPLCDVEKFRSV